MLPLHTQKTTLHNNRQFEDIVPVHFSLKRISKLRRHYQKRFYAYEQLQQLTHFFKAHHTSDSDNIINKYQIPIAHIRTGVWCTNRKKDMMNREHGYWHCHVCNKRSHDAHAEALREYALLYNTSISNQEARRFLHVDSSHLVIRLFTNLKVDRSGKTRSLAYNLKTLVKN